ncbi:MAG: response regulator [Elusimicrobiales bacterium]
MLTVLVVDDDRSILELLKIVLEGGGYSVIIAQDAEYALQVLLNEPVDMVLSDINMPGLDGYQLLHKIRGNRKLASIPVMLLTIRADAMSALKGMEIGADEYLPKPFTKNQLLTRIKQMEIKLPFKPPEENL